MTKNLMIILGCDCDPDRPRYGGPGYDDRESPLKWRGLTEGLSLLRGSFERVEKSAGIPVKAVFFLRSDLQIREIHGLAAWSALEYAKSWRGLEEQGHELAWHPHLWRWSREWGCWFQEAEDSQWIRECLEIGHVGISEALGKNPASCHMGWTFHTDTSMSTLADLGVRVDFSACPGVFSGGGPGDAGTRYDNMIDWLGTPQTWYRPSEADYRRSAVGDEAELGIIEIPKFTSRSSVLRKAKELASRSGAASAKATAAFVQITAPPIVYGRVIKERLDSEGADPFFVTYFHPDELLPDRPRSAREFLYSLSNLEKNLVGLIEAARKRGRDVEFVTTPEALARISGGGRDRIS